MNRFLQDILEQPRTLIDVVDHFQGEGYRELRLAADEIGEAKRVVLTSMGSALFSLMPMHRALAKLHSNVHLVETAELLRDAPFSEETLYIIMSRSGESGEIARFAGDIRGNGGKLLSIAMTPDSTLARHADILVRDTASFDGLICTKAFTSLSLTGLLIAAETGGEFTSAFAARLKEHFVWMDVEKERILERLEAMAPFKSAKVVYALSRGTGMTVAAMAALLMEEGVWQPASSYSFGMFHHGPVEIVDGAFAGFWIDLDPDERSRELFDEANGKGGTLIAISHRADLYPQGIILPSGDLPEPFRIFSSALVVQLAAYATAVARGQEPGEMRYLNWLVT